ncbi:MAG: Ig-like domain-containing protein [Desulfuromonadaceae bacterium]|nr:Ig-like domain-containing protein [Desulfuromonadaceae bacterium]
MELPCTLYRISRCTIALVAIVCTLINGCGSSDGTSPAPNIEWASVSTLSLSSTTANIEGTSWVSNGYYASTCAGLACFIDTSRTNDYPGVDVTYVNLTTGATGHASSYYGPGTNWVHKWYAGVPVAAGINTIQFSAYDPGGKGGSISVEVMPPPPLTVSSTTPMPGAAGVLANTTISAQLSGSIAPRPYYFLVNGPTGTVAGTWAVNDSTVTFTPASNLAYNSTYTVTIPTSLKSFSGSSLLSDYTWSFATMGAPIFGVLSTYPAAGETNVPTTLTVSATFNGKIDIMYYDKSSFIITSPTGVHWGYSYSVNGATVTVTDPIQLQANTTYTATLTRTIRDTTGHQLLFDYVWTFTTGM